MRVFYSGGNIEDQYYDVIVHSRNKEALERNDRKLLIERPELRGLDETFLKIFAKKGISNIQIRKSDIPQAKYIMCVNAPICVKETYQDYLAVGKLYCQALALAQKYDCKSIALPIISTGSYSLSEDKMYSYAESTINWLFEYDFLKDSDMEITIYNNSSYAEFYGYYHFYDELTKYLEKHNNNTDIDNDPIAILEKIDEQVYASMGLSKSSFITARRDAISVDDSIKMGMAYNATEFKNYNNSVRSQTFQDLIRSYIIKKGYKQDSDFIKKVNVSKQTFYNIFTRKNYLPSKKTAIRYALTLKLSLEEAIIFLAAADHALFKGNKFDLVIMYCFEKEIYDIYEVEELLSIENQSPLCTESK